MTPTRTLAMAGALAGWIGLGIQLVLFVGRSGPVTGVWHYLGFFTTLSNIAIAIIAMLIATGRRHWLTGPRPRMMGLVAVLAVALVYSILLRSLWDPHGWDKVTNVLLHDVTSLLFLLLWLSMPHGGLRWSDLPWALAPPAVFLAVALLRGAFEGWYPYYFLDPATKGVGQLAANLAAVMVVFTIVAGCVIAVDQRLAKRRHQSGEGGRSSNHSQ